MRTDVGYFAARALLTQITGNAAAYLVERGAAELSGPMINSFMAEIVSRFSIVVSDRIAASALPVVGAVGGATVNVIFMNHFQQIAQGHFTVRRLEREYGAETGAPALCRDRRRGACGTANDAAARHGRADMRMRVPAYPPDRRRPKIPASPACGACASSRRCCWSR